MTLVESPALLVTWPAAWAVRLYGDLAWPVVVAAAVLHALPLRWVGMGPRAAVVVAGVLAVVAVLLHAVGQGAGAQALGLALQQPSGLLAALAVVGLWRRAGLGGAAGEGVRRDTARLWPAGWALLWVVVGAGLYADALGAVSLGLYPLGLPTGPQASWAALFVAGAALAAWQVQAWRPAVVALALALALHALTRLPTGNLWDALLDPMLWLWSAGVALRAGVAGVAKGRASGRGP